jgi:2-hydroxychromene-2-carboxylate isomerase
MLYSMPPKSSSIIFYFDFISPYAWLAFKQVRSLVRKHDMPLLPVPVLFAGLLNAHGQLGPAEIPAKREYLIKDVSRRANTLGLVVKPPPTHPFNPLPSLRLASLDLDADTKLELIDYIFDSAWSRGRDISDRVVLGDIMSKFCDNAEQAELYVNQAYSDSAVKMKLQTQTDLAIQKGVFGVPTTEVKGQLYWGSEKDTIEFIEEGILGRDVVDAELVARWKNIRGSASRRK